MIGVFNYGSVVAMTPAISQSVAVIPLMAHTKIAALYRNGPDSRTSNAPIYR